MAMTSKEQYEYAEELVRLATEADGVPSPQDLIDLIERKGEVENPDDQVAILNIVADLLHKQEQEKNDEAEESDDSEEVATSTEAQV